MPQEKKPQEKKPREEAARRSREKKRCANWLQPP
jgi:hypothetical protein